MQTIRRFFASLVVLFACQTVAYAQFTISGAIQDELGNPLNDFGAVEVVVLDSGGTEVWRGNNGDGTWTSASLADGDYYAYAIGEPFGRSSEVWSGQDCAFLGCDITAIGAVIPISGGDVTGVNFTLAPIPSYTITGSIQDASGNGIGGLIAIRDQFGEFVADLWVNGDGSPTTSFPIPAGQYVAYAGRTSGFVEERWEGGPALNTPCPNLGCDVTGGALIDLTAGDVAGIDFVLEPIVGGGRLHGNVVYPDGVAPVVGVSMLALNANGEYITGATTDRFGNFSIGPLSDGDVYLRTDNDAPDGLAAEVWNGGEMAMPGNTVCVPFDLCFDVAGNGTPITIAGSDVGALDFQLTVPPGGLIQGRLVDGDLAFPLADMRVTLFDQFGAFIKDVFTDAEGEYTFSGLANSTYHVYVSGPTEGYEQTLFGFGTCFDPCDVTQGTPLVIASSGDTITNPDLAMIYAGGPRITGIITRNDTGEPVSSRVAFMSGDIYDASGNFLGGFGTDRGGRYQAQLPVGEYVVITGGDQSYHKLVQERFDDISCAFGCDPTDLSPGTVTIPATGSQTAIANFGLNPARSVSGTVVSTADSLGIEGITVCVEPEPEPDGQLIACTNTDANGDYLIDGLPARSDYVATTFNDGLPFIDEVFNDLKDVPLSAGTLIDVTGGDATADFALDPGGTISGELFDDANNPLDDFGALEIVVLDAFGNEVSRGNNNGDNTWQTPTLPAGDYYAYAFGEPIGFTTEVWEEVSCPNATCDVLAVGAPIVITGGNIGNIDFTLAPAQQFTITGSIQDAAGNGIGGAISIRKTNGEFVADIWVNGDGTPTTSFPIPAGQYVVFANQAFGFVEELWNGSEPNLPCPNLGCDYNSGALVDLTAGDATGIDFVLDPIVGGGRLSGTVTDPLGNPVVGVSVAVMNGRGDNVQYLATDRFGNFNTGPLSNGDVYLRTEPDAPDGLAPELWNGGEMVMPGNTVCVPFDLCFDTLGFGTPITIADADIGALDFQLTVPTGGQLTGRVVDADLTFPLADQFIQVFDSFGGFVAGTQTDGTGTYTFAGLPDGDYKLLVNGPSEGYEPTLFGFGACNGCDIGANGTVFTVSGGGVTTNLDQPLQYVGGPRITGFVTRTDTGEPVSSRVGYAGVDLFDTSGSSVGGGPTDRSGRYQLVPPGGAGNYVVISTHDQGFHGLINEVFNDVACGTNCDPNDPAREVLSVLDTGTRTAIADFALDPGTSISGRITATDGGAPIELMGVCAEREPEPDYQTSVCVETDASGNYTINGLVPAADYVVYANNFNGLPFIEEVYSGRKDFDFTQADLVDVTTTDAVDIDFVLDTAASINGTITASAGATPLEGVLVDILDASCNRVVRTQTDAAGNYSAFGFGEGSFYVYARGAFQNFVSELYPDLPSVASCPERLAEGTAIPVAVGETVTGIDFALDPGASISGVISDVNGPIPPGEARARIFTPDGTLLLNGINGFFNGGFGEPENGYVVLGLPAGDYKVLFTGTSATPGLIDELYDDVSCPRNSCPDGSGVTISLTAGEARTGIDAVLETGSQISGRITDSAGNPLSALVAVYNDAGRYAGFAFSDANGDYTTQMGFPAGTYYVSNQLNIDGPQPVEGGYLPMAWNGILCGDPCDVLLGDPIVIDGVNPVNGIDFAFTFGNTISGAIQDEFGNPLNDFGAVEIVVLDASGNEVWRGNNGDSTWSTPPLSDGDYYAYAFGEWFGRGSEVWQDVDCANLTCDVVAVGTPISIAGGSVTGIDFTLAPAQEFTITGSIQDAGGNGIGGAISIRKPNGEFVADIWVNGDGSPTTSFPIPAGQYVAYAGRAFGFVEERWEGGPALNTPCPNLSCDLTGGALIDLTGGDVTGIDFVLDPIAGGGRLTGTVTDPAGDPVVGVSLAVVNATGEFVQGAATDRFGDFTTPPLSDGDVYLRVESDAPDGLAPEIWNGGEMAMPGNTVCIPFDRCNPANGFATPITIAGGDVTGLDFELEVPDGGQLTGRVVDADLGFPLADQFIQVFDSFGGFVAGTQTDGTGTYTFAGLPDGDYKLLVNGPSEGYEPTLFGFGACNGCDIGANGTLFTVSGGTVTTNLDQPLQYVGGPRITGFVTRTDTGEPVSSRVGYMAVDVYDTAGNFFGGFATDRGGRYQAVLPAGDYVLLTSQDQAFHGLVNELFDDQVCVFGCDPNDPAAVPVTATDAGTRTAIADFALDAGRVVSGTVIAADDLSPIANANVCIGIASEAFNGFRQCRLTDADGRFSFSGLGSIPDYVVGVDGFSGQAFFPELYDDAPCCDLSQASPIDTTSGDADITIDVARSATISGTVLDSGTLNPIAGVPVDLLDASCNLIANGFTDEFGNYTIAGFSDGTYYVHAIARFVGYVGKLYPNLDRVDPCFPEPIIDGAPISVVGTESIIDINFLLNQGASIQGFVSDVGGVLPQFNAQARLYATDGTQLFVGFNDQPDNSYLLQGLPAGEYNVILSGAGQTQGLIDEIFDGIACPRNSCPQGTGVTISLAPGESRTGVGATLETGSQISGRLLDGAGNPVQTCIAIYNAEGRYAGFACSDGNGDYTSRNGFPAGDYLVSNQFDINGPQPVDGGYLPVVWPGRACGEPCNFLLGDAVTVDGVKPATGIDLVFQNGSSIAGTVTGDGNPVSDIEVILLRASDASTIRSTTTAADGSFSFAGLAAGDYRVRTSNTVGLNDQLYTGVSCNPFCDPLSGAVLSVAADSDVTGIDFPLASTPSIVGTVLDDQGQPLSGVRVDAYNSLGALVASGTSASDGSFSIGNLFASTFFVRTANTLGFVDAVADGLLCSSGCNPVAEGTPISVGSSGSFPAGGLQMQLGSASRLFGLVSDGSVPLSSVDVEVYTPTGVLVATGATGDDGLYEIGGLAAGDYHVVTRNNQGFIDEGAAGGACPISCAPTTTQPIQVSTNQQFELDFALSQGASIAGRVVDAGGSPLASVTVTVFEDTGREVSSAITDASGNYRIGSLLPADYLARTTRNLAGLRNRLYDGQACDSDCDVLGGTLISLVSGASATGIDFTLPAGNSVSGSITDDDSSPLGGVRVAAINASGIEEASATTGANGDYTITGLPNGVYTLRTFNALGYIDQAIGGTECTPRRCDPASATLYDLQGTDATGASAALRSGQFLTGTATDDSGNPIFSGTAQLYSDQADLLKTAQIVEGVFSFSGLAGGTYYAVVTNDLGLVDQAWTGPGVPGLDCTGGSCLECLTTATCAAPPAGPAPIVLADPVRDPVGAPTNPRGASGSNLSFQLPSGERIRGTIVDAGGDPIPGITVYFFSDSGADAGTAVSDGQGRFESGTAFGSGVWFAATRRDGESGAIGFIDELFDDLPCGTNCDPTQGDSFSTPNAPVIDFDLSRQPTERLFGSGFEF